MLSRWFNQAFLGREQQTPQPWVGRKTNVIRFGSAVPTVPSATSHSDAAGQLRSAAPAASSATSSPDAADQLRSVMHADFRPKPVMSKTEFRVFRLIEQLVSAEFAGSRVLAQTSLGEILRCNDTKAFFAVNSKRVDVLVVSRNGLPVAAFEFQGGGHYQGTAAARDATKKEALRQAGVVYVEFEGADTDSEIVDRARSAIRRWSAPATPPPKTRDPKPA